MPTLVSSLPQTDSPPVSLPQSVWRANQMGSYPSVTIPSGYRLLDAELPNGGWPHSALIELLLQQPGIGEMRLLQPALSAIAGNGRIALLQPPHLPQIAAWTAWGLAAERLLWIRPKCSADALWCAEQILRNGSCGALLLWQAHVRTESLRRLHLAAQETATLFWMFRPLVAARNASPALLRLALRPASGGIAVNIVKRRGPHRDESLHILLDGMRPVSSTSGFSSHAHLDQRISAVAAARNHSATLV